MTHTVDCRQNIVDGGFFVMKPQRPYVPFVYTSRPNGQDVIFLATYAGSSNPIRATAVEMVQHAKKRICIASFMISDERLLQSLLEAVERLQGGVYLITALDERSLGRGLAELDEDANVSQEAARKQFADLTRQGIYVRGHESCHAKFMIVDDEVALVGSANFDSRGFDFSGEADVLVRRRQAVRELKRLFTRLWYSGTAWELRPGETYTVAPRQFLPSTAPAPVCDPTAPGVVWTDGPKEPFILKCIHDVIVQARREIVLASFSIVGMRDHPELLLEPVRAAVERGVRISMFVRQRNAFESQRADLLALHKLGVGISADTRNHAKCAIGDASAGVLFSSNFDAEHGLSSGAEVGVRLDGSQALVGLRAFIRHSMEHADTEFLVNPTLAQLDGRLAARWCSAWPEPKRLDVDCSTRAIGEFVRNASGGPVLFEKDGDRGELRLYAGSVALRISRQNGVYKGEPFEPLEAMAAADRFEQWLRSARRGRSGVDLERGFCAAALSFVERS